MPSEIQHDPDLGRFSAPVEGGEAYLAYRESGDVLDFYYTFVSPALRGGGLAAEVTRAGFEYARAEGKKVRPTCPYVGTFVKRNPRYAELLAGGGP